MGVWSVVLSVAVGVVFLALLPLVRAFIEAEANEPTTGQDAPDAALLISFGVLMLALLDLVALGLGVAGVAQRRHKKALAVLGILVSVLALIHELWIAWEPPSYLPPGFPTGPARR